MGEEDFDTAWSEGAALSVDEAIAYAQRGRGERKRPASGWASLTPAERDVVRLVSEGLANNDIATRLFVSPRTVQAHLTHVYTKLGLDLPRATCSGSCPPQLSRPRCAYAAVRLNLRGSRAAAVIGVSTTFRVDPSRAPGRSTPGMRTAAGNPDAAAGRAPLMSSTSGAGLRGPHRSPRATHAESWAATAPLPRC